MRQKEGNSGGKKTLEKCTVFQMPNIQILGTIYSHSVRIQNNEYRHLKAKLKKRNP